MIDHAKVICKPLVSILQTPKQIYSLLHHIFHLHLITSQVPVGRSMPSPAVPIHAPSATWQQGILCQLVLLWSCSVAGPTTTCPWLSPPFSCVLIRQINVRHSTFVASTWISALAFSFSPVFLFVLSHISHSVLLYCMMIAFSHIGAVSPRMQTEPFLLLLLRHIQSSTLANWWDTMCLSQS